MYVHASRLPTYGFTWPVRGHPSPIRLRLAAYAERYYPDFAGGDEALAVQIRQQSRWDEMKREAKAEAKSTTSKPNEVLRKLPAHISMAGNK